MVNLAVKNRALLAKWSWCFVVQKEALWRKVILVKYGSSYHQWRFRVSKVKELSSIWRGIVENSKDESVDKWMGNKEFRWEVGNGKSTLFWVDL